jgi:hypothetical protein
MKPIGIDRNEFIVGWNAGHCFGPGWRNEPLWVFVENGATGKIRGICLQPAEWESSNALLHIVPFLQNACEAMRQHTPIEVKPV